MIKNREWQPPPLLVGTRSQVFPKILILDINHLLLLISDDRGQAEHPEEGEQKENLEKQGQNRPDAHHPSMQKLCQTASAKSAH